MKINWGDNKLALLNDFETDVSGVNYYEDEPVHLTFLLSKEKIVKQTLKINFHNTLTSKSDTFNLTIDPSQITSTRTSPDIFKLAGQKWLSHIKLQKVQSEDSKTHEELDQKTLDVALKYGLLSQFTSFFGRIKNKNKHSAQLKSVVLPALKIKDTGMSATKSQKSKYSIKRTLATYMLPSFGQVLKNPKMDESRLVSRGRTKSRCKAKKMCSKRSSDSDPTPVFQELSRDLRTLDKLDYNEIINLQTVSGAFKSVPKAYQYLYDSKLAKQF